MNVIEKRLAVEKEQTRIAQELHDSVGHGLVSIMTLLKS
jgi:signal transduction histidine kinase